MPSAFTTVTNGARFAPLHAATVALFEDLAANNSCEVHESFAHDNTRQPLAHARPSITLLPAGAGAPLAVAFFAPMGVMVKCGWWYVDVLPSFSCDACDLTADTEAERLREMCHAVAAGGFEESLRTPLFGMAKQSRVFKTAAGSRSGWSVLPRAEATAGREAGRNCSAAVGTTGARAERRSDVNFEVH